MLAVIIGLIGGVATTMQASINTEARKAIRSPFITAGINFTVAWLCLAAFIMFREHRISIPFEQINTYPVWIWFGGVCAIIIVSLNIICLPKLGAAGNAMIVNFGQIMTGLIIDHFALFGSEEVRMSWMRLAGAALVVAGLVLVTTEKSLDGEKRASFPLFFVILAFIDGIACCVQIAVNGTLRLVVDSVSKATLISMSVAIISTLAVVLFLALVKGRKGIFDELPAEADAVRLKPWMLTGGLFALTVVSGNAAVAPIIGTGFAMILNLLGMMGTGLLIDAAGFLGIEKKPVTLRKVAGMLLMLAGTALISF